MLHVGAGEPWNLNSRRPDGIQIWPAYRGRSDQGWYRGTADALYQNRSFIEADHNDDVLLIICGDHIYKQDYRDLMRFHYEKEADLTISVTRVSPDDFERFGILSLDADHRVIEFTEKPRKSHSTLASMGIYVFNARILLRRLEEDANDESSSHEIGRNVIPGMVERDKVFGYPFAGYWADMGTIADYWESNLALLAHEPPFDLYDRKWMTYTRYEEGPPVKCFGLSDVRDSIVSQGCMIQGTVINSVLSSGVMVECGATVRDSVIMNDTIIRAGAQIDRCILDKRVEVGRDAQVGTSDDYTPNTCEPANLNSGITVVGRCTQVPAKAVLGRNCRIDPNVAPDDFPGLTIPSGATVMTK